MPDTTLRERSPLAPLREAMAALQAAHPVPATLWPAALELLATCGFQPCDRPPGWWITGPALDHDYFLPRVDGIDLCGCKQFVPRDGLCRHVVALALYRRLQEAPYAPQDGRSAVV